MSENNEQPQPFESTVAGSGGMCGNCLYRSGKPDKDNGRYWCAKMGYWIRHPAEDCTGYKYRVDSEIETMGHEAPNP